MEILSDLDDWSTIKKVLLRVLQQFKKYHDRSRDATYKACQSLWEINPKSGTWPLNFHGEVGDMHGGLETYMRMEG